MNIFKIALLVQFLLLTILLPRSRSYSHTLTKVGNDLRTLTVRFNIYLLDYGVKPKSIDDISISLVDPWRNQYQFSPNGFYSFGRDGKSDTMGNDYDDLNSWSSPKDWSSKYQLITIYDNYLIWIIFLLLFIGQFSLYIKLKFNGHSRESDNQVI
tara:strand:+ start:211 stop:675 length:465 start_codon:yes stop_codon:yes gene_type:complete